MTNRVDILSVPFDAVTLEEAVRKGLTLTQTGGRVVTPNPEIVWKCQTDPETLKAVASADLILADGVGIVRAAQTLKTPLPCRVAGVDWFFAMLGGCAETGKRVFLLGGKPGVAELAAKNAETKYPGLTVCGTHDGYFTDAAPVLETIKNAAPDFLAVCLGAPKQELWMARNAEALSGVLMAGLGGSLDVLAGAKKLAPGFIRGIGLEWLFSAVLQPKRIPRLFVIPKFMRAVKKEAKRCAKAG
ncbi:MAG: WecB/TagA/CpsF family glycosyltransferase [Oscillospiraceae bacterium]|jgi:N-acetylglucosaminyldiphosphoundecaprenol N-acetyl-beta-D-mannosaminyltransferase|nr:WecB/TagA/CpsF family glycosyltransferase [Oscillospiraceae bacterium]